MLARLHLKNFQSHRDTVINFDPGVNAIAGLSDSGKSAIFRALNWVINNKPAGADFATHGESSVEVELILSSGTKIRRRRTKSDNLFEMDGKEYRAFGQDVPEEIRAALNFADVNFHFQMDEPFLLGSGWSPGSIAQYLNRIARLDSIDNAVSDIRRGLLAVQQDLRTKTAQAEANKTQLAVLGGLDALEQAVAAYEKKEQMLAQKSATELALTTISHQLEKAIERSERAAAQLASYDEPLLLRLEEKAGKLAAAESGRKRLLVLKAALVLSQEKIAQCAPIFAAETRVEYLAQLHIKWRTASQRRKNLDGLLEQCLTREERVQQRHQSVEDLEEHFHSIFPDTCPLCGHAGGAK